MQTYRSTPLVGWFSALSMWPFHLARVLLQRQVFARRQAHALAGQGSRSTADAFAGSLRSWPVAGLANPFDLVRAQYAAGVQAGLIERSLLASGALERRLAWLERLTLGPWARGV